MPRRRPGTVDEHVDAAEAADDLLDEGVAIAAPTNVAFTGPELRTMMCPNIGRWHLTRFSHPDLQGVPLNYPTRAQLAGN